MIRFYYKEVKKLFYKYGPAATEMAFSSNFILDAKVQSSGF